MANTLLDISKITNEALMVLENELTFTSEVNREYDDQFAVVGAKIGATVNVRRPGRFIGALGPALNIEDFNETSIPVTLTTQWQTATQFTTQDLALALDLFSDRVLKPQVAAIATRSTATASSWRRTTREHCRHGRYDPDFSADIPHCWRVARC